MGQRLGWAVLGVAAIAVPAVLTLWLGAVGFVVGVIVACGMISARLTSDDHRAPRHD